MGRFGVPFLFGGVFGVYLGSVAQSVEQWPFKPMVVGSIPTRPTFEESPITNDQFPNNFQIFEFRHSIILSKIKNWSLKTSLPHLFTQILCFL